VKHDTLKRIMAGDESGPVASAFRLGLSALTPGYRLAIAIRNRMFDHGLRKSIQLPRPTLSVGNLTTGGTGKTPMVIELARRLIEQGSQPAVLLRGYMAQTDARPSDEARQLADELGSSVPVEPNPNRAQAAARVIAKHPNVSVFLLDDAFQHRQVRRDLDIVLIDATEPFGFGRLLPRGLLREPAHNLKRADAVIVTRSDLVDPDTLAVLDQQIQQLTGQPPLAHTLHRWTGFRGPDGDLPEDHLRSMDVVGVSAIGNPKAFEKMLQAAAGRVIHCRLFDDHHPYTREELDGLLAQAHEAGAQALVTTEKDWVKLRPLVAQRTEKGGTPPFIPILRPAMGVQFLDGEQALNDLLQRTLEARP
jgi:tetraacyldisaccharide 4'-kinase